MALLLGSVCVALFSSSSLLAQTTVYASAELTDYGYSSAVSGNFAYSPDTGKYSIYSDGGGVSGGVLYLFPSASRLRAGIDLRGMYSPGARGGEGSFASLRIQFVPRTHALSPYFELGGGFLSTTYAGSSGGRDRITGGAADFNAGLEVNVNRRFAIKAIELGGFAGTNVAHASVGVGVALHLDRRSTS